MEPLVAVAEFKNGKVECVGADAESAGRAGHGREGAGNQASRRDSAT